MHEFERQPHRYSDRDKRNVDDRNAVNLTQQEDVEELPAEENHEMSRFCEFSLVASKMTVDRIVESFIKAPDRIHGVL